MCRMAQTAVVTGASGYIATELVKQLLEKGYNVRGTVRSLASKEKVEHLQRYCKQTGSSQLIPGPHST